MANLTRVTQGTISQLTVASLQDALGRVQTIQERLASGKQITKPSDDPGGTVAALNYRSQIRRNDQYGRNAERLGLARIGRHHAHEHAVDDPAGPYAHVAGEQRV